MKQILNCQRARAGLRRRWSQWVYLVLPCSTYRSRSRISRWILLPSLTMGRLPAQISSRTEGIERPRYTDASLTVKILSSNWPSVQKRLRAKIVHYNSMIEMDKYPCLPRKLGQFSMKGLLWTRRDCLEGLNGAGFPLGRFFKRVFSSPYFSAFAGCRRYFLMVSTSDGNIWRALKTRFMLWAIW